MVFTAQYELDVWLENQPLPITADIRALKDSGRSVYVLNPPTGNWIYKFGVERDWRDTRAVHLCPATHSTRRETS